MCLVTKRRGFFGVGRHTILQKECGILGCCNWILCAILTRYQFILYNVKAFFFQQGWGNLHAEVLNQGTIWMYLKPFACDSDWKWVTIPAIADSCFIWQGEEAVLMLEAWQLFKAWRTVILLLGQKPVVGTELLNDFLEGENGEPRHQLGFEELQCYVHCLWHPAWHCLLWSLMIKFNSWHQHWNWAVITNIMLVQRWQLCVCMLPLL